MFQATAMGFEFTVRHDVQHFLWAADHFADDHGSHLDDPVLPEGSVERADDASPPTTNERDHREIRGHAGTRIGPARAVQET